MKIYFQHDTLKQRMLELLADMYGYLDRRNEEFLTSKIKNFFERDAGIPIEKIMEDE